jgi:threonine aldolase
LGAPIGSILLGERHIIEKARKFRKILGGGWRQAGILAAAALYAVEHHMKRLEEDHKLAQYLGNQLKRLGCRLCRPVQTNMVFVDFEPIGLKITTLAKELEARYQVKIFDDSGYQLRLVIHMQTPKEAVDRLLRAIELFKSSFISQ